MQRRTEIPAISARGEDGAEIRGIRKSLIERMLLVLVYGSLRFSQLLELFFI